MTFTTGAHPLAITKTKANAARFGNHLKNRGACLLQHCLAWHGRKAGAIALQLTTGRALPVMFPTLKQVSQAYSNSLQA